MNNCPHTHKRKVIYSYPDNGGWITVKRSVCKSCGDTIEGTRKETFKNKKPKK